MQEITIPILIGFIGLVIGSYTDIRTREVPDWINYGMILTGFAVNVIYAIVFSKWSYIIYSLLGFGLCLLISLMMFYTGQWGGGDSKMLMGLGALIGLKWSIRNEFLMSFFVNIIIIGGIYGFAWSIFLALKNFNRVVSRWKRFSLNKGSINVRNIIFISSFIIIIFTLIMRNYSLFIYMALISTLAIITFYLWIFIRSIEEAVMIKAVPPNKLTEGDWIAENVYLKGKYLCGPNDLGISKKQIRELKKLYILGRIKKVLVKNGIPFVPSFLIAYALTFFISNILGIFM